GQQGPLPGPGAVRQQRPAARQAAVRGAGRQRRLSGRHRVHDRARGRRQAGLRGGDGRPLLRVGEIADSRVCGAEALHTFIAAVLTLGIAGAGSGLAAPFGGATRFLGTNPWSIGLPIAGREPFVMDFATTTVAEGKVRVALASGQQVPEGALLDTEGMPTRD